MATVTNVHPGGASTMDDVITQVGLGPWSFLYFTVAALSPMTQVISLVGGEFMAPAVNYTCADVQGGEGWTVNGTQCYVWMKNSTASTSCKSFSYDNSSHSSTLTQEFNLVCSRAWLKELFQLLVTTGCLVGSPLGGLLADKYGRQPVVFYGTLLATMATVVLVTVPVLEVILAARFLIGVSAMIYVGPAFTLGMEICPLHLRTNYGVTIALPYALMLSLLAGIGYICRSWRAIQLWGSLPLFFMMALSNPLFLKESPRWLVTQGRIQEADQLIQRGAKLNKKEHRLLDNLDQELEVIYQATSAEEANSFKDRLVTIMTSKSMREITLISLVLWAFIGTIYLSIPLYASAFASPYVFMALMGLAEVPAYTLTAPITEKMGRKNFIIGSLGIVAILEGAMAVLMFTEENTYCVCIALSATIYVFICSVFQVNLTYCSELYPTSVRTLGMSIAFFCSNVGFNVPPILNALLLQNWPWIPVVIYSLLAFFSALLVLKLPETNKRPLLQSVLEYGALA